MQDGLGIGPEPRELPQRKEGGVVPPQRGYGQDGVRQAHLGAQLDQRREQAVDARRPEEFGLVPLAQALEQVLHHAGRRLANVRVLALLLRPRGRRRVI